MEAKTRRIAERFSIIEKIEKLEKELLAVKGVSEVDFDLDGFYDDLNEVIILAKYDVYVPKSRYFVNRRQIMIDIQDVAYANGLKRTIDRIEDYGEHFYMVFSCGDEWCK